MSKSLVFGATAVLMALAGGTVRADKEVPVWEKSTDDQYKEFDRSMHGGMFAGAAKMDQYGGKLHEYGRYGFVYNCFENAGNDDLAGQAVKWALCGDDLKALNLDKIKPEISERAWDMTVKRIEGWKAIGAEVEAAAKKDPGIAAILKQKESAQADWKDFEAKNRDAIALYEKLKAGIRSGMSNDKSFEGCWDATQPAFAKLVKATKFEFEVEEPMTTRMAEMKTNTANYLTVANFGMCAFSQHESGAAIARAALPAPPGIALFGWRTMLVSKLVDPKFKPKFANRDLTGWESEHGPTKDIRGGGFAGITVNGGGGSMTLQTGTIAKVAKNGDETTLSFKKEKIDTCLSWADTNKIQSWAVNGDPIYKRTCQKRGKVDEQLGDITVGTKFADGLAPGVKVSVVENVVVEAWKGKKFVAIFGVPMK